MAEARRSWPTELTKRFALKRFVWQVKTQSLEYIQQNRLVRQRMSRNSTLLRSRLTLRLLFVGLLIIKSSFTNRRRGKKSLKQRLLRLQLKRFDSDLRRMTMTTISNCVTRQSFCRTALRSRRTFSSRGALSCSRNKERSCCSDLRTIWKSTQRLTSCQSWKERE